MNYTGGAQVVATTPIETNRNPCPNDDNDLWGIVDATNSSVRNYRADLGRSTIGHQKAVTVLRKVDYKTKSCIGSVDIFRSDVGCEKIMVPM